MTRSPPIRILFVCLGNICRSPTAEGVFVGQLAARGLATSADVDSCGTAHWHVGKPPDARSAAEADRRGYDISHLRGRQLHANDFLQFDYILAMDRTNLEDLRARCPEDFQGHLGLFLAFAEGVTHEEVPDPYYGGEDGFAEVFDLVEAASEGLIRHLHMHHGIADADSAQ
ncbi:MAG: low molecular weight protein-tyrosine-phosphatase [Pseudomonadota bacterium]